MELESVFGIRVDAKGAQRGIEDFNKQLGKGVAAARGFAHQTKSYFDNVKEQVFSLKGAMTGLATSLVARQVIGTIAEFEKLEVSLKTVTGSAKDAKVAMAFIKDFAQETPFQVQEITNAFIKLQSLGLEPSREALTSYGDTASAMGKSLNQMIEAVADASVGEFERLKEFGIKASSEGDQVAFRFKGQTTRINKDAQSIQDYLISLGQTNFAGGMIDQMNTISGKWSNLQDQVDALFVTLGNLGAATGSRSVLDVLISAVSTVNEHLQKGRIYALTFVEGFETIRIKGSAAFELLSNDIAAALDIDTYIDGIKRAWLELELFQAEHNPFEALMSDEQKARIARNAEAIRNEINSIINDSETSQANARVIDDMNAELATVQNTIAAMIEEEEKAIAANKALADSFVPVAAAVDAPEQKLSDYEKALNKSADAIRQMIIRNDPALLIEQQLDALSELLAQGKITSAEFLDAWEIYNEQYEEALAKNLETTDTYTKFAERAAENMQDAFADYLFDPFDASLSDMFDNLANTLRRMAAEIIAQQLLQQLFSAMSGSETGWISALGSAFAGSAHSGGIVGSTSGGRSVSPAAFVGAQRYHSGGIVGDEVPIIARRGEEVLTENDPRHSNNLNRGGSMGGNVIIQVIAPDGRVEPESIAQLDVAMISRMGANKARNG